MIRFDLLCLFVAVSGVYACKDKFRTIPGHTACLKPSSLLVPGTSGVTAVERQLIVDEHNTYRGSVQPPAANMQKMMWDDELADLAQLWAGNCIYSHDQNQHCIIPGRFSVGQNLHLNTASWNETVTDWYAQHRNFSFGLGRTTVGTIVGDYVQMVYATAARIGCGKATCTNGRRAVNDFDGTATLYVCNYAFGVTDVRRPYIEAKTVPCEHCPGRCVDGVCDCGGLVCENGGVLDLSSCTCNCRQNYAEPLECKLDCSSAKDEWYCTTYPRAQCLSSANLRDICPVLCNVCPWSGFNYTEGSVPIPTPTPRGGYVTTMSAATTTATPASTAPSYRATTATPASTAPSYRATTAAHTRYRTTSSAPRYPTATWTTVISGSQCSDKYMVRQNHSACLPPSNALSPCTHSVSNTEKKVIVQQHNRFRGKVAASNMQKMVWDDELADVAQRWASNCQATKDHHPSRDIPGRFSLGQNIAANVEDWQTVIEDWFVSSNTSRGFTGDQSYLQMMNADSSRVGCGYAECQGLGTFFVCNYAVRVEVSVKLPYRQGLNCADCPGRCADDLCDCGGKVCGNRGKMNVSTCSCSCPDAGVNRYLMTNTCAVDCTAAKDHWACGTVFKASQCDVTANVAYFCPYLCHLCPWAGYGYIEGSRTVPSKFRHGNPFQPVIG